MAKSILFFAVVALLASGCASKKAIPVANGDFSEPMAFDTSGSDSKKIDGLNSVHFDFDSSVIAGEAKEILTGNATWIKKHKGTKIQIEGHCDLEGSVEYNLALGERRAKAVRSYLIALGVKGDLLTTISYGKEKPLTLDESEKAQAQNRRANFVPIVETKSITQNH